jgi:hypothetical protein
MGLVLVASALAATTAITERIITAHRFVKYVLRNEERFQPYSPSSAAVSIGPRD